MDLRPGDARDFFSLSSEAEETLARRRSLLGDHPDSYLALPEEEAEILGEALRALSQWTGRDYPDARGAGVELEPDWVLLRPDGDGVFRVVAGVVCFPSEWSLPEKLGLTLSAVHSPVPMLNDDLGAKIDTFLARLGHGDLWERENWGLSADGDLDHHPRLIRPRLEAEARPETTWVRLERQLFARLPGGGVLFGIRVTVDRLDHLCAAHAGMAARVARALLTMPAAVAAYKGIPDDRTGLVERLGSFG